MSVLVERMIDERRPWKSVLTKGVWERGIAISTGDGL